MGVKPGEACCKPLVKPFCGGIPGEMKPGVAACWKPLLRPLLYALALSMRGLCWDVKPLGEGFCKPPRALLKTLELLPKDGPTLATGAIPERLE